MEYFWNVLNNDGIDVLDAKLSPGWNWSGVGLTNFENLLLFGKNILDVLETTVLKRWHE